MPNVGYEYCPARRHIDNAAAKVDLQQANPVQAPGVRDHGAALANAFDKLPAAEKDKYVSATGSLIYLSVDRYDLQYVVRLLAQKLNDPTHHDMLRLKHVIKYLLGTADWVWQFPYQKRSGELHGLLVAS